MNEIRVKRMLLGGCATFVAWVVAEIMIEGILSQLLFGDLIAGMWQEVGGLRDWKATNILVSTCLALGNSTLLIWLYASLRPMYGVGTKTALITSAFGIVWGWLLVVNAINLGLLPAPIAIIEGVFETIEFPIAILAGAEIYEGAGKKDREAVAL
jgi:hypothetical protein